MFCVEKIAEFNNVLAAMRDYYGQLFPKTDKESDIEMFAEYDFKYKVLDTELEKRAEAIPDIMAKIESGKTFTF